MQSPRRRACLRAMGIDTWVRRGEFEAQSPGPGCASPGSATLASPAACAVHLPGLDPPREGQTSMPRSMVQEIARHNPSEAVLDQAPDLVLDSIELHDWDGLNRSVSTCTACALHAGRIQTVFGVGDPQARLMIVGEAPGADEDRQGAPFVGPAGRLLDAMLLAIGIPRQSVYIANVVKCRPPGNRDPQTSEIAACSGYLRRQISLVAPQLILAVGRVAAQSLLGSGASLGRLRGRVHRYQPGDIPLLVTYHPAFLLRDPAKKAVAWLDLQQAYRLLASAAV